MKKMLSGAMAGMAAIACVLSATPAAAQNRDWNRDHNGRGDHRGDNRGDNRNQRWNTYGGNHGYNGYRGQWRSGQRFSHWNDRNYYVSDYGRYNLPPPRRGYRYYRDDNGDIVMAAIGTGIIGLILGSQLGR